MISHNKLQFGNPTAKTYVNCCILKSQCQKHTLLFNLIKNTKVTNLCILNPLAVISYEVLAIKNPSRNMEYEI